MKKITYEQRVKVRRRFEMSMRKLWLESPYRSQALDRVKEKIKVGKFKNGNDKFKVKYRCDKCDNLFEEAGVEVDHIKELTRARWDIPLDEDIENLVPWMYSLFCDAANLQVLCIKCHARKTALYMRMVNSGADLL